MTNPNQPPHGAAPHGEPQPQHRRELDQHDEQTREQIAEAYITHVTEQLPAIADRRIRDAYSRHGVAFAIYLAFEDTNRSDEAVETDFENAYIGFYDDRQALIEDTTAVLDRRRDLDELLQREPLLTQVPSLSADEIWDLVTDHYEVINFLGGTYVYEAAP